MAEARQLLVLALVTCSLMGCVGSEGEGFSIYLLATEESAIELGDAPPADLQIRKEPVISSAEIVRYNWPNHEIELTEEAYNRIQRLFATPVDVQGIPFAVCVDSEPVYVGAFWTPVSSISYSGVVIGQPLSPDQRIISIGLGYPGRQAFTGQDPRPDPKIKRSLESAGKLSD